jgi:hypothetical protein
VLGDVVLSIVAWPEAHVILNLLQADVSRVAVLGDVVLSIVAWPEAHVILNLLQAVADM